MIILNQKRSILVHSGYQCRISLRIIKPEFPIDILFKPGSNRSFVNRNNSSGFDLDIPGNAFVNDDKMIIFSSRRDFQSITIRQVRNQMIFLIKKYIAGVIGDIGGNCNSQLTGFIQCKCVSGNIKIKSIVTERKCSQLRSCRILNRDHSVKF